MARPIFEALSKLRQRGLRFAFDYVREVAVFDWIHRTDTRARKLNASNGAANIHYVPSFTSVVGDCLDHVRTDAGASFANLPFIDIGSGKGKVVLIYAHRHGDAARYPAIGIEYDRDLCSIANTNVARMGLDATGTRILHADARDIRDHVAADDAVFFLYNPFIGKLFHDFIDRLIDLPHYLIYVDPVERPFLETRGYRLLESRQGRYHADSWLIARYEPGQRVRG